MTSIVEAARDLGARVGPVFPMRWKVPLWKGYPERATRTPNGEPEWARATGVALLTGPDAGHFVLDVDGAEGADALQAFEVKHGPLPKTWRVLSGNGHGFHDYFRSPGFTVHNSASLVAPKIDVRGWHGYAVAPPSLHKSGNAYRWETGCAPWETPLADAPEWLLAILRAHSLTFEREPEAPPSEPEDFDLAQAYALADEYLDTVPAAVSGDCGHDQTWDAALKVVRGYGLGESRGFDLLWRKYNPRCRPPWPEKDVRHKAEDAMRNGRLPWGCLLDAPRPLTDSGNAERFAREHGKDVRYCRAPKQWLVYDGARFARDDTGEVERRAKATVRALYRQAADTENKDVREATAGWARKSEAAPRRDAMLHLARSERAIAVRADQLDADAYLFNVENGTIDLRSGQLRAHSRADLITKLAPVEFDASARCPTWEMFLERVLPDEDTRDFLQRWTGYALSGDVSAEGLCVAIGKGANGKSTFAGTVQELLGDYARSVNPELLLASKNDGGANKASPDLMALRGVRFALCAETEEGRTLSAAMVKRTSSTDKIAARQLHAESCEFPPSHKLFLMTNHRPRVRTADDGTWRRIFYLPFAVTIPEAQQDKGLRDKLRDELPGILAWAVRGCLEWQKRGGGRNGLAAPAAVLNATKEYRDAEDTLAPFLEDCCVIEAAGWVATGELYETYQRWAERNKEPVEGSRAFRRRIEELPGVRGDRTSKARIWRGLSLRSGQ